MPLKLLRHCNTYFARFRFSNLDFKTKPRHCNTCGIATLRQCNTCANATFGAMQYLRHCNTSVIANRRHCNTCVIATVIFQNFDPVSYKKPDSERENASLQHMRHCNVAFLRILSHFVLTHVLQCRKCCIDASVALTHLLQWRKCCISSKSE